MSQISRRRFCQFAVTTLATLGLSQLNLMPKAERYGKFLAQITRRKLALLVGINQYKILPLDGCITDVEMQRHLLIHRFGFNPKDIYIITDQQATRQGILSAFEEHLIKQAKPGDVAVFHYSGHGSLVRDPHPIMTDSWVDGNNVNGTLVPIDSTLSIKAGGEVRDIMGHTLFLLMSAIKTENFTAVIDSCFSGSATRKEFKERVINGRESLEISPLEKSYQERWLARLNLTPEEFVKGYKTGVGNGVVLAATNRNQTAKDVHINGFFAGIFSYLLIQYLWEQTSTPDRAIAYTNQQIPESWEQNPTYEVKVGSGYGQQPIYLLDPATPAANAAVTEVNRNRATLWLGGLNHRALANSTPGRVLTVVSPPENLGSKVTLQSRRGLVGIATFTGNIKPGMLLRLGD
ncbi:caspase family protein [Microseira wollei]|uniref:Peptidase C14 caspase domain-containing protein n=1 Tax=Microseira wollei NIES-4236 TaxID=2530354 RepID=A0AAV3XDS4_9CYAN|nr:caspase family protein [Microseira wollei]GET37557.1 hypothetical protein MiSe_23110 [Microseira wollei NIES-4236]